MGEKNMSQLICPNCNIPMTDRKQPDLTVDTCPKCHAVYLHKGELNSMATGMSGDIEYCSVDREFHQDTFPERFCPLCRDQLMKKINLLRLSNIILDYCPRCEGFFLDKGEIEQMNEELKKESPSKSSEEYRAMHGSQLVRIDQTSEAIEISFLGVSRISRARYIRVSVLFEKRLPVQFHLTQEIWSLRLVKSLGIHLGNDLETGDLDFDAVFRIHGEKKEPIGNYFDRRTRKKMLEFVSSHQSIFGRTGSIDATNSHISYIEGPYTPESVKDIVKKSKPVVDRLVEIADGIIS